MKRASDAWNILFDLLYINGLGHADLRSRAEKTFGVATLRTGSDTIRTFG
jgi:hypothetical protein